MASSDVIANCQVPPVFCSSAMASSRENPAAMIRWIDDSETTPPEVPEPWTDWWEGPGRLAAVRHTILTFGDYNGTMSSLF